MTTRHTLIILDLVSGGQSPSFVLIRAQKRNLNKVGLDGKIWLKNVYLRFAINRKLERKDVLVLMCRMTSQYGF